MMIKSINYIFFSINNLDKTALESFISPCMSGSQILSSNRVHSTDPSSIYQAIHEAATVQSFPSYQNPTIWVFGNMAFLRSETIFGALEATSSLLWFFKSIVCGSNKNHQNHTVEGWFTRKRCGEIFFLFNWIWFWPRISFIHSGPGSSAAIWAAS